MERILVSSSTFKLSTAGVDVTKATASQLIFDGFGQYAYNGVYMAGSFPSASMTAGGAVPGYASSWQGVINFGKTFAAPPQCVVRLFDPNHSNSRIWYYLGVQGQTGGGAGPVMIKVTTTSLTVIVPYSGTTFPSQLGFSYAAMQI